MNAEIKRKSKQGKDDKKADILQDADPSIFFGLSNDLLCIASVDGYFLKLNNVWEKALGYTINELLASPYIDFVHPDDRRLTAKEAEKVLSGSATSSFENRYICRNGSYKWLLWSAIYNPERNLIYAAAHDITELKAADAELRNLNTALANAVDGIAKVNANGLIISANKAFADQLGYAPDELIEVDWQNTVVPAELGKLKRAYEQMLISGKATIEANALRKDGACLCCEIIVVKACEPQTEPYYHYYFMKDIREHKHVLMNLEESRSRFAHISKHLPGVIYQFLLCNNGAFHFPYISESCKAITEYEPFEIQSNPQLAFAMIYPNDLPDIERPNFVNKLSVNRFEGRLVTRSGIIKWIQALSTSEILDTGDVLWNGLVMDITDQKVAEERIRQLNQDLGERLEVLGSVNSELENLTRKLELAYDQALEASRLKSEFVANISHEVRTPISAVIGMCELLSDTELNGEQKEFVRIVSESAQSLLAIINDILDFSKMEAGKIELEYIEFDIVKLIEGSVELLASSAKDRGLALLTNIDPQVARKLWGDPVRLKQIILNLAGNAVKFTEHGEVVIGVRLEEEVENKVKLRFSVSDTGIGMSLEAKKLLFRPFVQADGSTTRKYGGTGLGLSICKRLVELMNGTIEVESTLGQGSIFAATVWLDKEETANSLSQGGSLNLDIKLPFNDYNLTQEALYCPTTVMAPSQCADLPPGIIEYESGYILLAEDNPVIQAMAVKQLNKLGYKTRAVNNGQEALAAVKQEHFDLILMDCQMPVLDGFEATRAIRKEAGEVCRIPIIAMTASAMQGDRENCIAAGMDDYLSKPVDQKQLKAILWRWCKEKAQSRETAAGIAVSTEKNDFSASGHDHDIIDLDKLKCVYGKEGLNELLQSFLVEGKTLLAAVDAAVQTKAARDIALLAHQFKGLAAVMTLETLAQTSLALEQAAKEHNWNDIAQAYQTLTFNFQAVENLINSIGGAASAADNL